MKRAEEKKTNHKESNNNKKKVKIQYLRSVAIWAAVTSKQFISGDFAHFHFMNEMNETKCKHKNIQVLNELL